MACRELCNATGGGYSWRPSRFSKKQKEYAMLRFALFIVLLLIAALLFLVATRPARFRVQRSIHIDAPRERLFALVSDFHNFDAWSPWAALDPSMRKTFSGADNGQGAVYEWQGNSKVGQGRMEIVDAVAPARVVIKLDFLKPFKAHNTAEYLLTANGEGTEFAWVMHGSNNFLSKLMGVFFSMDKMVGGQFEQGLASLKALAEEQQRGGGRLGQQGFPERNDA